MVCPYCNNHPIPNALVCNHCGVILKIAKASRKRAKRIPWRRMLLRAAWYLVGAVVGAAVGYAARFFVHSDSLMATVYLGGGIALGLIVVYLGTAGRVQWQTGQLNRRRRKILSEIEKINQEREKRIEEMTGANKAAAGSVAHLIAAPKELDLETRLDIATENLISGHVEQSLQQLEQVYRLGQGARADFLNNCGVAFARRGQTQLSLDRFQQAIRLDPRPFEPRVNMVYSALRTGDKTSIDEVLSHQNGTLDSAQQPGAANRIGLTYATAGNAADGERYIERALKSTDRGDKADAHNDLGIAKALSKNYREAITEFAQALHSEQGHAPAMANVGLVYYQRHRFDEATDRFETAAQVDPHSGMVHSLLGASYCRMLQINEGIRAFRDARTHGAHLFEPNYNLGKVYVEHDIFEEAERSIARAYEMNPYAWQILVAQAVLLFKTHQIERAMSIYNQASKVQPDEPKILDGLALCMTLMGDYQKAENYFRRAMQINKDDPDLLTNFSWFYLKQSQIEQAAAVIGQVKAIQERHAVANNNMALCQMEMGAYDAAMQYFKQALKTDPSLNLVWYNLGCDYVQAKAIDSAIDAWEQAKKFETGNADLHTNLGVAYYKSEKFDKAGMEFRRVLHLRQERAEDYANLGLTMARMKRHKDAIEQFELGLQIEPNNAMLHSNLGLANFFANNVEASMREWQIVTKINKKYAQARAHKQQSEYDDSTIAFVPIVIPERALYTPPKVPDYLVSYVPGYRTSHWEIMITNPELSRLAELRSEHDSVDRAIRALKL